MFQVPLATSLRTISVDKFWETTILYYDRPHLVNRKLVAVLPVLFYEIKVNCSSSVKHVKDFFTKSALLYETRRLKTLSKDDITVDFIKSFVHSFDKNATFTERNLEHFRNVSNGVFVSVRILLPKSSACTKCIEVVILDKNNNIATFSAVHDDSRVLAAPPFSYDLQLLSGNLKINVNSIEDVDTTHAVWLTDKLFTKFLKWAEQEFEKNSIQSLSLVATDAYFLTYMELKSKYGEHLVKEWPKKSNTDPQKYVYEDIAIASYLICLWKKYSMTEAIRFVDCGCGNGLLVYILNQEGYEGFGLDIRRRPTWDIYPKETKLEEQVVTQNSLFPNCTWIIGNHSDELTPWIPIIALKSSPSTNFFVLPCCPYDLNGKKYIRTNTGQSQYSDYLNYIKELCKRCGFQTEVDKLRIPSTKRTCLVGNRTKMSDEAFSVICEDVSKFVEARCTMGQALFNFTPREKLEKVRNCTQLDRDVIKRLVHVCVGSLLVEDNFVLKMNGDKWNKGTTIQLSALSNHIPTDDLKKLKKECGGLQTLLRNHRYLFEIKDGFVMLRPPFRLDETDGKYKNKPCWFNANHPNGCLYDAETCAYQHC